MGRRRCLSLLTTLVASSTAFSVVDDDGEGAWPAAGETLPPVAAKHKAAYDAALHRRQLIIGGNTAPRWQHTHQILLTSSENIAYTRFKCGGSLLAANIVLTAAHCFNGLGVTDYRGNPVDYWIHAHRWHLPSGSDEDPACSATIKVARVIRHELYDPDTDENDVAILHLEERAPCVVDDTGRTDMVELDDCYQKSCWKGQTMIAKGWGNTAISGRYEPEYLQEVELEVQPCTPVTALVLRPQGFVLRRAGALQYWHRPARGGSSASVAAAEAAGAPSPAPALTPTTPAAEEAKMSAEEAEAALRVRDPLLASLSAYHEELLAQQAALQRKAATLVKKRAPRPGWFEDKTPAFTRELIRLNKLHSWNDPLSLIAEPAKHAWTPASVA